MPKSDIAMSPEDITALENEELAPEKPVEREPVVEVSDKKGKSEDLPEFVAEPEEGATTKADAKKAADAKAKKPEPEKQTTVPHGALHAEREEHRKTRAIVQAQEVKQARLEERLNQLYAVRAQAEQQQSRTAPEPTKIPVVNDDPLAAIGWLQQEFLADRAAKAKADQASGEQSQRQQTQTAEQRAAEQEWNTAYRAVTGYWERAAAENPQITDAYNALRQSYAGELKELGWSGSDIVAQLNQIEAGHILNCYHSGTPIDDFVTRLAKSRGWKPKTAEEIEAETTPATNGRANENADKLKSLARAQDASDTLSGMGGGAGGNKISLDTLERMPNKEFNALIAKLSKKGEGEVDRALEKMMGIPPGRA